MASCCSSAWRMASGCRSHNPVEPSMSVKRKLKVPVGRLLGATARLSHANGASAIGMPVAA
jgi:hypothetical protein